jgi:glutaminase
VSAGLFGISVVSNSGCIYALGDARYEFAIMNVAKPFGFARSVGLENAEEARANSQ